MTDSQQRAPTRTRLGALVQAGFFLSGMTGLIYEVIWLRVLATAFGSTTLATSVVLTAFMGGLALGSLIGGRKADLTARPFRLYGALEVGIGVYCFASLWLLHAVRAAYLAAARHMPFESPALAVLQFGLTVAVLLIPTALMGATLPVVSRGFVRRVDQVGAAVANLYGINTFGAVLGTALAGFFLLPLVGLHLATWSAAGVNLAIGLVILGAERRGAAPAVAARQAAPAADASPAAGWLNALLLVGFGLSGMAALALEVAWTRTFVMMTGSSIYAFTSILVAVLAGIALGSLAVGRLWGERPMSPLWFGAVEAVLGLLCLGVSWAVGRMPLAFFGIYGAYHAHFAAMMAVELAAVLLVLAAPTLLMGATMPILSRVYITRGGQVGTLLGRVYASNTVGAIVGSFAAGYLVIPLIGVRPTILAASAVYAAVGVAVLVAAAERRRWPAAAAVATAAITIAAVVLLPSWRPSLMSAGVFLGHSEISPDQGRVVFYKEGPTATVAVISWPSFHVITLTVNGKTDASTGEDMGTQLALGHLPVLLAERPRRALVIGLGSGITAGAMAQHPLQRLDVVEIEPAVARGARYFAQANRHVLEDPRCHLVLGDARSYVASTRVKYDVISSEPSNPWIAGIGSLFTVEHFRDCQRLLAPGGVMCQWIHGTQIGTDDLATVVRSFLVAFPRATLWTTGTPADLLLVSARDGPVVRFAQLRERMQASGVFARPPESEWMPRATTVAARLVMGPEDLRRFARLGRLNTDDFPALEFSAPLSLYATESYERNAAALAAAVTQPANAFFDLEGSGMSRAQFRAALAKEPQDAEASYLAGLIARRRGDEQEARKAFEAALRQEPNNTVYRRALKGLGGQEPR